MVGVVKRAQLLQKQLEAVTPQKFDDEGFTIVLADFEKNELELEYRLG